VIYYKVFSADEEDNYAQYVKKQGGKMLYKREAIVSVIPRRIKGFARLFRLWKAHLVPGRMLCLGARTGCEAQGARDAGYPDSIGIDLHPVGPNVGRTVIKGDMHKLEFPENSFMNVYTNSFDHCYDLPIVVKGVKRVLNDGGVVFFQVMHKMALEGALPRLKMTLDRYIASRAYDTMYWDRSGDVSAEFEKEEFVIVKTGKDEKWYSCFLRCKK